MILTDGWSIRAVLFADTDFSQVLQLGEIQVSRLKERNGQECTMPATFVAGIATTDDCSTYSADSSTGAASGAEASSATGATSSATAAAADA